MLGAQDLAQQSLSRIATELGQLMGALRCNRPSINLCAHQSGTQDARDAFGDA
jgi:hypothetical protein